MANIQRAEREGKEIRVGYDCLDEQKIYLCLTNPRGDVIAKPAKKGQNLEVLFQWATEAEASDFQEAYVADQAKQPLSKAIAIVDTIKPNSVRLLFYKAFGIPFFLLFLFVLVLRVSSPREIFEVHLTGAYFQNATTIRVEGRLSLEKGSLPKILERMRVQLLQEGVVEKEIPLTQSGFVLEVPCVWDGQKKYEVLVLYKDNPLSRRNVQFHPQFPIARLSQVEWKPNRILAVSVFVVHGSGVLDVELYPSQGMLAARQSLICSAEKTMDFTLGPIEAYAPQFLLFLKAQNSVLDRKTIPFSSPCGKILSAAFSSLDTATVQGFWRGPELLSHLSLEMIEKPLSSVLQQKEVSRDFSEVFSSLSIKKEYTVQLRHAKEKEIVAKADVFLPPSYREYLRLVDEMPSLTEEMASLLCSPAKESAKRSAKISQGAQLFGNHVHRCQILQKQGNSSLPLDSVEKFYRGLQQIAIDALAEQDKNPATAILFESLLQNREEVENILNLLNPILAHFHPDSKALAPFLDSLREKKAKERKATLIEYVHSCALSGQYLLALEVCEAALLEYPSDWPFLVGRHYLQIRLAEEDPRKADKAPSEEDQRKLLRTLQVEFQKKLMDLHYSEAYELGQHLLSLKPNLTDVAAKMQAIQDKIKTPTAFSLRFTHKSLRK